VRRVARHSASNHGDSGRGRDSTRAGANLSASSLTQVVTPFWCFRTKRHCNIPTGTPSTGASNAGGVGKHRDLGQYLVRMRIPPSAISS